MRSLVLAPSLVAITLAGACSRGGQPDAFGNIEATEVVVSAETGGQLRQFVPAEGSRVTAGELVAMIDTTQLALQLQQLLAQRAAGASRVNEVKQQGDVLAVQRDIARRAYERIQRLYAQEAATAQQLDQAERDYKVLDQQIEATRAQRNTVTEDVAGSDARAAQIRDQIRKSSVRAPSGGTVLATYARAGEIVQPGQPLFRIADLDTMELRAYVAETQLARVKIGQPADVSVDAGGTRRVLRARVTWIASQAEFTPTPIQTRDERANLVYAVKLRVPNTDSVLKIGMPADVRFAANP